LVVLGYLGGQTRKLRDVREEVSFLFEGTQGTSGCTKRIRVTKGSVQNGEEGGDVWEVDTSSEDMGLDLINGFPFQKALDVGQFVLFVWEFGSIAR